MHVACRLVGNWPSRWNECVCIGRGSESVSWASSTLCEALSGYQRYCFSFMLTHPKVDMDWQSERATRTHELMQWPRQTGTPSI